MKTLTRVLLIFGFSVLLLVLFHEERPELVHDCYPDFVRVVVMEVQEPGTGAWFRFERDASGRLVPASTP